MGMNNMHFWTMIWGDKSWSKWAIISGSFDVAFPRLMFPNLPLHNPFPLSQTSPRTQIILKTDYYETRPISSLKVTHWFSTVTVLV